MNERTMELFRELTEASGAPGFEQEVRRILRARLTPVSEEIVADRLGGLFGKKTGRADGPVVMVAGHMDEVGFMVTGITDKGMIKFAPLGGWWSQVLLAQRMQIATKGGRVVGVVGSTPPHLLDEATRAKPVDIGQMFLDIGADDRADAEAIGVRIGQPIVPICPFTPLANPKKIMAKAWDNRYGVGLAIELMEALQGASHPNVVYAGATVQEEVGLRGAETASALLRPDIAFVLDASPANDASGDKSAFGQLGKGALLRVMDRTMITHRLMVEFVRDTAETHKIPYQYFISPGGGTDAGRVHLSGTGVPTAVVGIPARYIHTAAAVVHTDDYAAAKELLIKLVTACDRSTVDTIVRNE
ncbi:M42 family metallopeptidase [Paenibacillus sp.]|uniref:M42 family metallopeptidase n=1 Tax=Paenibacillus sp. TaxID=58172 RepID=UPI002D5F5100|nr:M42 family metallopeptidase [Paenibacillus sp.]HZG55770.1 M42 family metallopeptidase [Paenibacillus sp.]